MLEKLHKSSKTRRKGEKPLSACDIQEPELEIEMLFRKKKHPSDRNMRKGQLIQWGKWRN